MVSVLSLLIPIALSAVLVFIASSVIHMVTPWHKGDLQKFPNEDAVLNALAAAEPSTRQLRPAQAELDEGHAVTGVSGQAESGSGRLHHDQEVVEFQHGVDTSSAGSCTR